MLQPHYKKSNSLKIEELEADLKKFIDSWQRLSADKSLLQKPLFLQNMAHNILRLNIHAKEVAQLKIKDIEADLIHFILHTPWGAPFVAETTLVEAASYYADETPLESTFHALIELCITYSDQGKIPLFDALALFSEEAKSA